MVSNITNNPNDALFKRDICALHKEAIDTLDNKKVLDDDLIFKETYLDGYIAGILDMLKCNNTPDTEITSEDYANTLDEMMSKGAIVEDMNLRRAFILLCEKVIQVHDW